MTYKPVFIRIAAAGNFEKKFILEFQKELQNLLWELGIKATCFSSNLGSIEIDRDPKWGLHVPYWKV